MVDFPSAVNAPGAGTYIPPNVNLAPLLMSLPQSYYQGEEQARQSQLKNMFRNGVPKDAQGNMDLNAVAEQYLKLGEVGQVAPLIDQQNMQQIARYAQQIQGGGGQAQPQYAPPQQQPQGDVSPGFGGYKPPGQSTGTTGSAGASNESVPAPQGTVLALASRVYGAGGELTPQVSNSIAARIGVSPTDKLTPPQAQQAAQLLREQMNGGEAAPTAQPRPAPQPTQQPAPQPQQPPAMMAPTSAIPQGMPEQAQRLYGLAGMAALMGGAKGAAAAKVYTGQADAIVKQSDPPPEVKEWMAAAPVLPNGQRMPFADWASYKASMVEGAKKREEVMAPVNAEGANTPLDLEKRKALQANEISSGQKRFEALTKLGEEAPFNIDKAELAQKLIDNPDFYSGAGHEVVQLWKEWKTAAGTNPNEPFSMQAFNKTISDLLMGQVKSLGQAGVGPVRVAEVRVMQKAIASLGITPDSNRYLLEEYKRVLQSQDALHKLADEYVNRPGGSGYLDKGFNSVVDNYYKEHPLFKPEEKKDPRLIAPPAVPQAIFDGVDPQSKVTRLTVWAKQNGRKTGDPIRLPDGSIFRLPRID